MDVLPDNTTLGSFFIVTAVFSVITFAVTFNLKLITVFLRKHLFAKAQKKMLQDPDPKWKNRGKQLGQESQNKRKAFPGSKWLYVGYLFHGLFRRSDSTSTADDPEKRAAPRVTQSPVDGQR